MNIFNHEKINNTFYLLDNFCLNNLLKYRTMKNYKDLNKWEKLEIQLIGWAFIMGFLAFFLLLPNLILSL